MTMKRNRKSHSEGGFLSLQKKPTDGSNKLDLAFPPCGQSLHLFLFCRESYNIFRVKELTLRYLNNRNTYIRILGIMQKAAQ